MNIKRTTVLVMGLALCIMVAAGPVHNRCVTLSQPDGTTIQAVINGDEFRHTVTDAEGHFLAQDKDGFWRRIASAPEGDSRKRAARSARALRMRAMNAGDREMRRRHCIVVLAEFPDRKMQYTREDFVRMLTEEGYSAFGATGSAKDYFSGQLGDYYDFTFGISETVMLDHESEYYFGNNTGGTDKNPEEAVKEACEKAFASGMRFSDADADGDGEVDNVFIFVAGKDEADGGGEDCVWSHMFMLENTRFKDFLLDGVIINSYAISTELRRTDDGAFMFTSIGTFCHEYGHVIGLMDMYDTDYGGSGGTGNGLWYVTALMDGGNGNNQFNTPPAFNAVDYDMLGIGECIEMKAGKYVLEPVNRSRKYVRMETGNPGEYWLFECRDGSGWDRFIGGSGLLVYHIDKSSGKAGRSDSFGRTLSASERWRYNEVNCRPDRQCAMLVPPVEGLKAFDNNGHFIFNQEQAFWKEGSLSPVTSPALLRWDREGCRFAISDIAFDGSNVSFTVTEIEEIEVPDAVLDKTEVYQDAAIISWHSSMEGYTGDASFIWGEIDGKTQTMTVKPYEPGRYAVTLENLEPRKSYKASILFTIESISGDAATVNFSTKRLYPEGYPFIFLNNSERLASGAFRKGAALPLRVYNAIDVKSVEWTFDGQPAATGPDGYYHLEKSGVLKAYVLHTDGSKDVIIKHIEVE